MASLYYLGTVISRVLAVLDALDRHRFDKMDATNSLDTLYSKVIIYVLCYFRLHIYSSQN